MKKPRSQTQALRIKNTPFADFHMELRGLDIVNARTGQKIYKWQVWQYYKDRPEELRRIIQKKHKSFKFVPHNRQNEIK